MNVAASAGPCLRDTLAGRFGEDSALSRSSRVHPKTRQRGRVKAHFGGSGPGAGNYGDHPPRDPRGRAGSALRAPQGFEASPADQYVGKRAQSESGAGGACSRRSGGADSGISGYAGASGIIRQNQDAAEAGGTRIIFPENGEDRAVQRNNRNRQARSFEISDSEMLAAGWRAVYYLAVGHYQEPRNREAQCGRLPDAGV